MQQDMQRPQLLPQQNTPVKDSAWKKGNCFGCNSPNCTWLRDGDVVCPHRDRPGVRKRAQLNFKKFKDYKKQMREKRKKEQGWGIIKSKQERKERKSKAGAVSINNTRVLLIKSIADSVEN